MDAVFHTIHPDLFLAQEHAYKSCNLLYNPAKKGAESREYAACIFEINNYRAAFRVGKITPRKNGHFVTLWKRLKDQSIIPYDLSDPIDLFVISVRTDNLCGQFVFPKNLLYQKGVISRFC